MFYLIIIIIILAIVLIHFLPKYFKLTRDFDSKLTQYKETALRKEMDEYSAAMKPQLEKAIRENVAVSTQTALAIVADWQVKYEEATRQDAINKSQAIMMGKVLEHLIPFFPEFKYNPKDARFLGSPTDLIVFDGLSEGKLRQIIFVEVKTNTSQLTERERQIRDIINNGQVKWSELRHEINRIARP